jgi:hypothetical protein
MKGLRPYETKTVFITRACHSIFFKFFIWVINIFSFSLLTFKASAQTCTSLGDPVINQTFGTKGYKLPLVAPRINLLVVVQIQRAHILLADFFLVADRDHGCKW